MRGVEAMDNNYRLLDLTVYGRQETWEDSPIGWPQRWEGKAAYAYRWTSHLPVVSPEGRVFGRPGNRQALTSFLHHSDWHLRALTCSLPRRNSRANATR